MVLIGIKFGAFTNKTDNKKETQPGQNNAVVQVNKVPTDSPEAALLREKINFCNKDRQDNVIVKLSEEEKRHDTVFAFGGSSTGAKV